MFGYTQQDLLGQTLDILVPPSLRDRHSRHLAHFLNRPSGRRPMGTPLQIRGIQKSGRLLPIDIQIDMLRADDQVYGVAFVRDNTQTQKAFEEQSRARDSMAIFLRTTSHDIRTALNAIQVSTSVLREESKGLSADQLEHVDILEAGCCSLMSCCASDGFDFCCAAPATCAASSQTSWTSARSSPARWNLSAI